MEGYYGLASQFRTQDEPNYCGLSTIVMVLNTLEVCYRPKRSFGQGNIFRSVCQEFCPRGGGGVCGLV